MIPAALPTDPIPKIQKEVILMFPVPIAVEAFLAGLAAGKQICDFFED